MNEAQSRLRSARLEVVKRLHQYGISDDSIIAILGISKGTFQRIIASYYLSRRPSRKPYKGEEIIAKDLAIRVLVMTDYSISEIVSATVASQADLYRRMKKIHEELDQYTLHDRTLIARWISQHWLSDWEPLYVREYKEQKRRERWVSARRPGG